MFAHFSADGPDAKCASPDNERSMAKNKERNSLSKRLGSPVAARLPSMFRLGNPGERGGYLRGQALALYRQGHELGDNATLSKSIAILNRLSDQEYTRERVPLQWAAAQNNLGVAFTTLGEREQDTALLEQAIKALTGTAKEATCERASLQWAAIQTNLGGVLQTLGVREPATVRLKQAVTAYQDALKEYTREHAPLVWAVTQNNLNSIRRDNKQYVKPGQDKAEYC
jgi:tetratricopeptide (TPR) repeat protein